jgi:hypothetical protein
LDILLVTDLVVLAMAPLFLGPEFLRTVVVGGEATPDPGLGRLDVGDDEVDLIGIGPTAAEGLTCS